jgi:hypothetical protein
VGSPLRTFSVARPILPNPLIATFMIIDPPMLTFRVFLC